MSKERLEEINNFSSLPLKKRISLTKESIKKELKANDYHMPKNININTQYLLEIIEQAERVQELEKQNKRYREALEQIKKEETVITALPKGQKAYTASGHIARKALEGEE